MRFVNYTCKFSCHEILFIIASDVQSLVSDDDVKDEDNDNDDMPPP